MIYLYSFFLFLSFLVCEEAPNPDLSRIDLKILFVGNSLTYSNDLPKLIKEIAHQDNVRISFKSICLPDYSLEDHLNDGNMQQEIASQKYQFIVAQQGPSALPESQAVLLRDATLLASLCKKANTQMALYMVWPASTRSFDLDNVIKSYTNAARQTNSLLCPAGLAWKNAWKIDKHLPLYSSYGFHPSILGSVLAALSIYTTIGEKNNLDFIDYQKCSWKNEMTKAQFEILKQSALKAIGK
jgi:hypothetical protein